MATYYASGTNKAGEIRGMARARRPLGVAADQCLSRGRETGIRCEDALLEVGRRYPDLRVFVDSGAFSEVSDNPKQHKAAGLKPEKGVLKTVKPITKAEWNRRLALMERVGQVYGKRLLVIAPDKVGDQAETLRRLRWFRNSGWLKRLRRTGAEIAVAIQGGKLDPVSFDRMAAQALGWPGYAVAFPMAKGATPLPELIDFMQRRVARRVHLLGIGPQGRKRGTKPSGPTIQRKLFDVYPRVDWSWDSALVRQTVSRDPKKLAAGKAPYTMAQDIEREDLGAQAWDRMDFTELGSEPSLWLLPLWGWPKARKCMAELLEHGGQQLLLGAEPRIKPKRAPRLRADTPAQRAAWGRKRAKWAKCRREFEAAAYATGRRIGVPESELALFAYDPDRYVYSDYPGLEGGWTAANPRYVNDAYFQAALESEFGRWMLTPFRKGGPPEVAELLSERAVYRAFREREIELPGQKLVVGLKLLA